MAIKDAILKTLGELNSGATTNEIFNHIVKHNYHDFGNAPTPENTLSSRLGDFVRKSDPRIKRVKDSSKGYLYFLIRDNSDNSIHEIITTESEGKKIDKFVTSKIRSKAFEILESRPQGIRFTDLRMAIWESDQTFKKNTINGAIWDLDKNFPKQVYKADRGLFRLTKFKEEILTQPGEQVLIKKIAKISTIIEEEFYRPFAEWLVKELEECTKAIPLGGNIFRDKWGTPDVIGILESKKSDIIPFATEIISAEIKADSNGLITAFGQACAYKIFSHKSYIVVPKESQIEDVTRLDTLCRQFGIGLILFDNTKKDNPEFEIRARAIRHEPDRFFVNKNLKLIEDKLF
jgi:hypothetical protein